MFKLDTREIAKQARGLRNLIEDIPQIVGDELVKQVNEFADSGRNPDGTSWPALMEPYATIKQKKFGNRLPNKKATGAFRRSVKARGGVIAPDEEHIPQGMGLEKKRKSFEASPVTAQNIERILVNRYNAI